MMVTALTEMMDRLAVAGPGLKQAHHHPIDCDTLYATIFSEDSQFYRSEMLLKGLHIAKMIFFNSRSYDTKIGCIQFL